MGHEFSIDDYGHPGTHPASMITEDAARRFATDAEKTLWNAAAAGLAGANSAAARAETAATNAEAAEALTDADAIATAADRVQTGLDAVATAADVVTTNADVVTTNADAITCTTKAGEAATSASDAATDAATILAAIGTTTIGKHTIWIPATAMLPALTNGPQTAHDETTTYDVLQSTLTFDAAVNESAQFLLYLPKSWDLTNLSAAFVWFNDADTGDVVWSVKALSYADNDTLDSDFGAAASVTDTSALAGALRVSPETANIVPAGVPAKAEPIVFQISRLAADAADTLISDARLLGIRLLYTVEDGSDD